MLSVAAIKSARAEARARKIFDRNGLHLHIYPSGRKVFRLRFWCGGKEQLLTIGRFPEVSLSEARDRSDALRAQLRQGIDPRARRAAIDAAPAPVTFEAAARAWHALHAPGWTAIHAADVLASLERDIFPAIGADPVAAIAPPAVLAALRAIEARGARETARRVRQRVSAVFAFAISEGWRDDDPAAHVARGLRKPAAPRHQPALADPGEARALLAAVNALPAGRAAQLASRFLALTAMRWAAVRGARWDEIADLDGAAPVWRVPAERMKLAASRKADAANDHLVPLAPAAVAVLREAAALSGGGGLVFPARPGVPLGESAIAALYRRTEFAGRHVPHGWRAAFSTILNERFPDHRGAIDQALGHALRVEGAGGEAAVATVATVERAYNRSEHLAVRRLLMLAWAEILAG